MKILDSSVIAIIAFVVLAAAAVADPGTTWEKKIAGAGRFTLLSQFNNDAVFDRETGRVWEQSPDTGERNWFNALLHCYPREVGGRKGWRLPTIEELASLVDTSRANPSLPNRHPFSNVQSSFYWSATTIANIPSLAFNVDFSSGDVIAGDKASTNRFVWCVRGGQGIDGVQ